MLPSWVGETFGRDAVSSVGKAGSGDKLGWKRHGTSGDLICQKINSISCWKAQHIGFCFCTNKLVNTKARKPIAGGLGTRLLQGHSLDTAEAGVVPLLWWVTGSIGLGCNSVEFVKQQHLVASGALAQSSYGWILHSFSARGTL